MNFVPYPGKIWFEPIKQESVILSDDDNIVEAGKVLGIGEGVEFCKEGDTIFFLRYGAEETPEIDGKKYWTVASDSRFIMGKYV
jgi:co-chaperonin GroES (HSP10)